MINLCLADLCSRNGRTKIPSCRLKSPSFVIFLCLNLHLEENFSVPVSNLERWGILRTHKTLGRAEIILLAETCVQREIELQHLDMNGWCYCIFADHALCDTSRYIFSLNYVCIQFEDGLRRRSTFGMCSSHKNYYIAQGFTYEMYQK